MTPEAFQKRLADVSRHEGVPFGRVHMLLAEERKYGFAASKLNGYLTLSDAFKCVFLEAVELINNRCFPAIGQSVSDNYAIFLPRVTHAFQTVCGAERAALNGYPLLAYTALRNVLDNNVLTAAAAQRLTTFYEIEGIQTQQPFDPAKVKSLRKKTEFNVREQMTGEKSGLTPETIAELAKWDDLFDMEVHGARLSMASALSWMKGEQPLAVMPRFAEMDFAIFVNRYCEVSWMTHRLLPLLQPTVELPDEWQEKWEVIDDSFRIIVRSLTDDLGKKIGAAVVEFVDRKFPFSAKTTFTL